MSNELTSFAAPGGLMSLKDLQQGLVQASTAITVAGDKPLLKMQKGDGSWVYGPEDIEVERKSLWAINPLSIEHGYVAWNNAKPEGERMVSFIQPMPNMATLPPVQAKAGWQEQRSVVLVCVSGEDEGQQEIGRAHV